MSLAPGGLLTLPVRRWRKSLPFRVVVAVLAASTVVLALTGWSMLTQAHQAMTAAEEESARAEIADVIPQAQARLLAGSPSPTEAGQRVGTIAAESIRQGGLGDRFQVVVETPAGPRSSAGIDPTSIPAEVREQVASARPGEITSRHAVVRFADGHRADTLVLGSVLGSESAGRYPVYFAYPLDQTEAVLDLVRRTALQAALVLVPLLALLLYAISLQVLRPLREARQAVESIARGDLDRRMAVVGSEDEAQLARSVNHMAEQLSARLSELEAMSLQQHQFVSDVAHELRTPLTTVRMAADVIYEGRDEFSPVMTRSAELLSREVDRFETLLHDLLDLSRIDAGAAVLAAEEVDVVSLVQEEVASQQALADTYDTEVRYDGPESCVLRADPMRVRRIVTNLLSNAIEHGETRPVDVIVRGNDTAVAVAVRDRGVGLSEEDAAQVFTRFWRADPSRYRRVGGSGLGLAIALENAELHGGRLDVWGRPGEGAQFRLLLPREPRTPLGHEPWPVVPPDAVGEAADSAEPHGSSIA